MQGSPVARAVVTGLLVTAALTSWTLLELREQVESIGSRLESVAAEAAAGIEGPAHERIRTPDDAGTAVFDDLRAHLRQVMDRHDIRSPIYTLRPIDGGTEFVVMTNETPFVGERYAPPVDLSVAFDGGRMHTGLYRSPNGWWISGFAPVRDGPRTVAVVSVDRPAEDLIAEALRRVLWALILGVAAVGVTVLLQRTVLAEGGAAAGLRYLLVRSLSARIGFAGTVAVVVAVGIVGWLDHRQDRSELIGHLRDELLTTVRVAAPRIDPVLHEAVAASGRADDDAFVRLRDTLRDVQEEADLDSPVYTFRRDGEQVRFVVMTNEIPYVGDPYELRPGLRRTFEGGGPGVEGPYVDSHGVWISAWAPIERDGVVIGALQADHEVGAVIAELQNRLLQRVVFGLFGVAVAFGAAVWLGRSISRPIRHIADAAHRIERGGHGVRVPEGPDEVGRLGRAVNQMARALEDRERLRDMFGAYVARQVAEHLLDQGGLAVDGELREVSLLISDIRGYTALTESLGATEVVALLKEYFAILVEEACEHDGHVDKFMGDAMLCVFGAPLPSEHHRERAVAAARSIQRRLAAWNRDREAKGLAPVGTAIGIASGPVIVGTIGDPARKLEYTAIGDAVNLASRLCSKAGPGEILVSADVLAGLADRGGVVSIGAVRVKGVKEPVVVHRVG